MFKQLLVCVSGRPGSEAAQMKRSMMKGASDIFDNGAVNKPVHLLTFFNDTLFTVTHIRIIIQILSDSVLIINQDLSAEQQLGRDS